MVEFYDETLRDAVTRQLRLEDGLRRALDEPGEIRVAFQPLVEPSSGAVTGVEALARWTSPELGEVHPGEFIPVAENSGQISRLGAHVLDAALASASAWLPDHPTTTVAVNVSTQQLRRSDFAGTVEAALVRHAVPPTSLHLEVTESVALSPEPATTENVARLAALGVSFSLDDFGTGYSSLAALRRLPLAQMKVDRRLHDDEPVLRACLDLGRSLGLSVVAEGIESPEARERVRRLGYDVAQGYLFGRPMAADQLVALLARNAAEQSEVHGG